MNLKQVTINYRYPSALWRMLGFYGTTFVESAVYVASVNQASLKTRKYENVLPARWPEPRSNIDPRVLPKVR